MNAQLIEEWSTVGGFSSRCAVFGGPFPFDAGIWFVKNLRKEDGDYVGIRLQPFKLFLNVLRSIKTQGMDTLLDQYRVGFAELR